MNRSTNYWPTNAIWLVGLILFSGCQTMAHRGSDEMLVPPVHGPMPRELSQVVLPPYTVAPPDLLSIRGVHMVPKTSYRLRISDVISLQVAGALPDTPIGPGPRSQSSDAKGADEDRGVASSDPAFAQLEIEPGGIVDMGADYGGPLQIAGLTLDEAKAAILARLKTIVNKPEITRIAIDRFSGLQQIDKDDYLVGPDGTITLGSYGTVSVVGKTVPECRQAIEAHLSQFLEQPEVAVDVYTYNSKKYYVITEGAGNGDQVFNFPITGNETVLDAISNINGLTQFSSKQIWIARPVRDSTEVQILPVDWVAITKQGNPITNYQVLPGDRVFVSEDRFVAFDTRMGKWLAPWERVMGFSLLGANTVSRFSGRVLQGGGIRNNGNNFGGGGVF